MTENKNDDMELVHGSGNVWQDFGYPDADIRQAKGILVAEILGILEERKLSVRKAQELTGFAAADFSRLRNADYGRFTLDRLIKMLNALDETRKVIVEVRLRSESGEQATQGPA